MLVIKIVLIVMSVFLVTAVLLQEGKSNGLGTIEGGADAFLGKSKGQKASKKLSTLTTLVAIVFVVVVILLGTFEQRNSSYVPDMPETIVDNSVVTATATESAED